MIDTIDPHIFLISLAIGILITYLLLPSPKVILRYPNLLNIDKVKYVDEQGTCYKYDKKIVKCDLN
jgi:hypothetical protein